MTNAILVGIILSPFIFCALIVYLFGDGGAGKGGQSGLAP